MTVRRIALVLLVLLPPCMAASPVLATAQARSGSPSFLLRGEVRDYLTEQPIEGAVVQVAELKLSTVTDRNGYFELPDVPAGRLTFITASFGYETNREASQIGPGNILLVRLNPMAVELPGITVEAERLLQRLETRRLMTATAATVFESADMESSITPDMTSFIAERTAGLTLFKNPQDQICVTVGAGASAVLLRVFLDEAPVANAFLDNLQPRDLGLVEVYERLGMVRIYTRTFLERAAQAGFAPTPINLMSTPRRCA